MPGQERYVATADNPADARTALAVVDRWLEPASLEAIVTELGELYLRTARKKEDTADRKAVIALYARELAVLPADLVIEGIRAYRGDWFPPLDAIRVPIERDLRLRDRRAKARALRRFLVEGPDASTDPVPLTTDQRRAISIRLRALVDELVAADRPAEKAPPGKDAPISPELRALIRGADDLQQGEKNDGGR